MTRETGDGQLRRCLQELVAPLLAQPADRDLLKFTLDELKNLILQVRLPVACLHRNGGYRVEGAGAGMEMAMYTTAQRLQVLIGKPGA